MREDNHDFLKTGSKIFFAQGLDRPNQLDFAPKNRGFGATIFPVRFPFYRARLARCRYPTCPLFVVGKGSQAQHWSRSCADAAAAR
ncbi:MAG TPA: hypothetical protein VKR55_31680 [Bradyrhizobium sp.]|uniref:hypothetical protein n=1 Tax=Bradyrhizobium sp. TaxID=376 RepID=UPI002BC9A0DA|nr:hypothetical protein [Bradyrhizobium sp.]HLZ06693.1 hypothetical protein [Bradyrhizobium sp.]